MAKRQPLLIADLDGTVVNTYPVFRELMVEKGFHIPEMTTYGVCVECGRCQDPRNPPDDCPVVLGFFEAIATSTVQPVEDSRAGVEAFLKHGWELLYLSSRQPQLWKASCAWLEKHGFPKAPVFCAGKWKRRSFEFLSLREENHDGKLLLIDDNPDVVGWAHNFPAARVLVMNTLYAKNVPQKMLFEWNHVSKDGGPEQITKELWNDKTVMA